MTTLRRVIQTEIGAPFQRAVEQATSPQGRKTGSRIDNIAQVIVIVDLPHDSSDRAAVLHSGHPGTLAYYEAKLGFKCLGTWQDPPVYAIVARDQQAIHFRCAEPPTANPNEYSDELLDAYLHVEDADALYAEYAAQGVEFTRGLANMPWHSREFVVKDRDGRLLAFGANL